MTPDRVRSVLVVGGGIGGLTAANAFAKCGCRVTVLEKADGLRIEGSGIALNHNSQAMLRSIEAWEEATAGLPELSRFCGRHGAGRSLGQFDWPGRMVFAERAQLLHALFRSAERHGAKFVPQAEVMSVHLDGTVELRGGRSMSADLVVGADGLRSRVRRALPHAAVLRPLPFGGAVTLIPRTATDHDVLNGHWTEYWRRGRHIYTAPVGNDATYIAFFSINARGQGHRRVVSERDVQTATLMPLEVERWRSLFPVLEEQLSRITETPLWTRFVEVHLPRWSGNRVVVIGDAAHAMAPALGSGGTTAMSDAISLANAVCRGSIGEALTSWERAHRGFVDRVQASSRRWGYFFHLPSVAQRTVLFHGVKNSPHVHRLRFDYLHHRPELLGERRRDADREPGGPLS